MAYLLCSFFYNVLEREVATELQFGYCRIAYVLSEMSHAYSSNLSPLSYSNAIYERYRSSLGLFRRSRRFRLA